MASPAAIADKKPSKRRWLQFSLRSFLLAIVVISIFLGWIGNILVRVRNQRDVVAQITVLGGKVNYDYQLDGKHIQSQPPPGPKIFHKIIGDDAFAYVEAVFLNDPQKNSDAELAILAKLPRLNDVAVYGPNVTDVGMEHIANIPKLRGLSLTETKVTSNGLARLRLAPDLMTLTLHGETVDDETLKTLNQIPKLECLQLVRTNVTSAGLAHLAELTRLRELDIIDGSAIGDDGMHHLARLTNLEFLRLFKTSVSDNGIPHLRNLRHLQSLNLDHTTVSDAGIAYLVEFDKLTNLSLRFTNVGNVGLGTIGRMHSIQHLEIGGAKFSDDGIFQLANLPNLQSLQVSPSDVSNLGILHLKSLHTLTYLTVGPYITEDAAKTLRHAIPNCRIYGWDKNGASSFMLNE